MTYQPELAKLGEILERARGRRVLVVGDLIADEYVFGETSRVSREAPVLILRHLGSRVIPGGAGNAVLNLRALGAAPRPVGLIGAGDLASAVTREFTEREIDATGIVRDPARVTIRKTRVMAGGLHGQKQQILRIDQDDPVPVPADVAGRLLEAARVGLAEADAMLLSDYGYGTLGRPVREPLIREARERGIPVCADSRYALREFRGVTFATPNEDEAAAIVEGGIETEADFRRAAEALRASLDADFLLLTRGHEGMAVAERDASFTPVPIWGSAEAADTTGAGDTVAASALLAITAGASPVDAARLATVAAGLVVQKHGAATTTREEIERATGIPTRPHA
jgi:rfaE bifunctional protein kinase chain/domain